MQRKHLNASVRYWVKWYLHESSGGLKKYFYSSVSAFSVVPSVFHYRHKNPEKCKCVVDEQMSSIVQKTWKLD